MSNTRLGLLAYATDTGLGNQTRAYYKHLKPSKTMVVDLSKYNKMPLHADWYPDAWRFIRGIPTEQDCNEFLRGIDCLLVAETPLNYRLFALARERGIKTVLHYNYEFLDYMNRPYLPMPDILAAPTAWHTDDVRRIPGATVQELPVPIDLEELPQRAVTQARRFFHTAGRPAVHDRNGTLDFIAAVQLAKPRMPAAEFAIYCQEPTPEIEHALIGSPIKLVGHVEKPADMYRDGDALVLPRRYGGLCLPAQEAVGSGIPVVMPDISPNNTWLPRSWLIPALPQRQRFMTRCPIEAHSVNVGALAQRMIEMYKHDSGMHAAHAQAKHIAQQRSWQALKPMYEELLKVKEVV